ncbi:39S ribosomal protein L30, mitochondrial [Nilaparvata lugens]|uniref:39S ribosomal protein L30, mitochondrial n=1 Tax=Nilaparvata lugens TaxID=108931 RepID=UPI00193CCA0A|nr:39S ribosomal protein L30, mitochondrial [Nilaparvata lugens]
MNINNCVNLIGKDFFRVFSREYKIRALKSWEGGIKHHGFTYYPRSPYEVDKKMDPPKLWMVQRIKPFAGNHWILKDILTAIGLGVDAKISKVVAVKNIPEFNAKLYRIKHLVKITPIKFINGEPTAEDINYCNLNEWGEFTITKKIDSKRLEQTEKFINDPMHLDSDTKRKQSRLKWINPWE